MVTARKTRENIKDVPATISAVTAAQLSATGPVTGTGDLLRTVAGVRFNDLQAPNLSEISIRGSGTERATGADSGVGLFLNGAYIGSSTLGGRNFRNIDFFDLERVEVLEGPQSALYGRNAEFGVVNIVSARPTFNTSGYVDQTFTGALNQERLTGVLNYSFDDHWAARIGAQAISQTAGFYYNPDSGKYYDQTNGWLARGQLRYRAGPLDVTLLVDGQDVKLPVFVTDYAVQPGTISTIPLGFIEDRFTVPSNGISETRQQVQRAQLIADVDLGWGKLTSTSMFSHFNSQQYYAPPIDLQQEAIFQAAKEIGVYPLGQTHTDVRDKTFYEDLHVAGTALGGALNYLVGGEILHQIDSSITTNATTPCPLSATAGICGGTPTAPICYRLTPASANCPTPFPNAFGAVNSTPQRYTSEAIYGSLRYTLGRFSLGGEARYTHDGKSATQSTTALYTGVQTGKPSDFAFSAGKVSYTLTASYKLPGSWNDLLYAKTGTGYRAGGVNGGTSSPLAPNPFQPVYGDEQTVSYEIGFKGNIGRHVDVTLDGYISKTDNAITSISDGCTAVNACKQGATAFNINGGTVHARGIEAAVNSHFALAGGRLDLSANAARQRARYVSANGTYAGLPIVGSAVAQIPDWTASVVGDYRHPLSDRLTAFLHTTYQRQSGGGQDTVTIATPYVPLATVSDISLRSGLDVGKVEVALFIKNLTDTTTRLLAGQTGGVTFAYRYNQPRTFGGTVLFRW